MSDPRTDIAHVSVHGGHTRFGDGEDSLAEVVHEYARQGFAWVGLTEHIPPVSDDFLFHGELEAGETRNTSRVMSPGQIWRIETRSDTFILLYHSLKGSPPEVRLSVSKLPVKNNQ